MFVEADLFLIKLLFTGLFLFNLVTCSLKYAFKKCVALSKVNTIRSVMLSICIRSKRI